MLAGLEVPDRLVLDLAACLRTGGFDDSAETLEAAFEDERASVALTITDREAILRALAECPYGLSELRGVLLLEQEWRLTEGLISNAPSIG